MPEYEGYLSVGPICHKEEQGLHICMYEKETDIWGASQRRWQHSLSMHRTRQVQGEEKLEFESTKASISQL